MKHSSLFCWSLFGFLLLSVNALAQTDGSVAFEGTLLDYNGSGTRHWTVVWVTRQDGTFIKTLRRQGPTITSTHWGSHCRAWYDAKGSSTALDGYSSATAADYAGNNSPVLQTWNCKDASNNLVPDGTYKLWMQYAEDSGQGPHTTNGLTWVKGPSASTLTFPNVPSRMTNLRVTWTPSAPPAFAPVITSTPPTGTGKVGVPYNYSCVATGTPPITFTASGLPTGLTISPAGLISGTPNSAGAFTGELTASSSTPPDAKQSFSILISAEPVTVSQTTIQGNSIVMSGTGPANGTYTVLATADLGQPVNQWNTVGNGSIDATGRFSHTNSPDAGLTRRFYNVRLP